MRTQAPDAKETCTCVHFNIFLHYKLIISYVMCNSAQRNKAIIVNYMLEPCTLLIISIMINSKINAGVLEPVSLIRPSPGHF